MVLKNHSRARRQGLREMKKRKYEGIPHGLQRPKCLGNHVLCSNVCINRKLQLETWLVLKQSALIQYTVYQSASQLLYHVSDHAWIIQQSPGTENMWFNHLIEISTMLQQELKVIWWQHIFLLAFAWWFYKMLLN